jgi:ATP-dependent Clp endopeptidase proteolytic subunit ClpP
MSKLGLTLFAAGTILAVLAASKHFTTNKTTTTTTDTKTVDATTPLATDTIWAGKQPRKQTLSELNIAGPRQVYITGEINEVNSPVIAKQILAFGKSSEPMTIIINSPGGSVFDGALILSAIEAAKGPVNTLCVQMCASMAAMIHQYGTNRLMLNRSVLMFHPAAGGVSGTLDQIGSRYNLFKSFIGKMEQNVATRAKISFNEYKQRATIELWIDAEDSVNQGFADKIVFVRGQDASKLFQEAPASVETGKVPKIPLNPTGVPVVPRIDWF